jgi:heavy metal sensor kinase
MMTRISIRLRLTLWYAAVLLFGMALFAAGIWFTLEHRLVAGVDERLSQRVEGIRTVLVVESDVSGRDQLRQELAEFAQEIPEGDLIELSDSKGALLPGKAVSAPRFRVLTATIEHGGETYHVRAAASLDGVQSVLREVRSLLAFMIPLVLLVACIGGYWISTRALAPVDEITRTAKSISVQNLSARLRVPRTGDELQRLSETWNEMLERLETAVGRMRQFTADASHELRTPLALIRATADLALRRERKPEEYVRSLRDIQSESARMTDLAESLLELTRADNAAELTLAETDLNAIVEDVVTHNREFAAAKGVTLESCAAAPPAVAPANESAIRRLLTALIDNAVKYTPAGGTVTVATARRDGGIALTVADTGEGIEPGALPHIFERFYRADPARSRGNGVGLGLSIAQAIAQAHGSRIAVESRPGEGARFEVLLQA